MRSTKAHRNKKTKKRKPKIMGRPSNNKSYVGYCHNIQHKGWITLPILVEHDCLGKECSLFEKCLDHPLWHDKKFITKQITYKQLERLKQKISYPIKPALDSFGYEIQTITLKEGEP